MKSPYSNFNQKHELKDIISNAIKNKNQSIKRHSDSVNCLINCAEYRFTIKIIPKQENKNSILFFMFEKEALRSPLFFYQTPSNEIMELIEKKNISENYLNESKMIKIENEIINNYDQNKKNNILLFNHLKFPLININSKNNSDKNNTIIILDEGKYDAISNHSFYSDSNINNNYSLLFDIHNLKNADYLFSINDIKDCKEIQIKFNGNIHGQNLFKNDAICWISPDIIINSIQARMKQCINLNDKNSQNNCYKKFFFTKINDKNCNNIGILFYLDQKKDINEIKFDNENIMNENYKIYKIFFCVDMWWINGNNFHETKDTSKSSSEQSNNKKDYYEDCKSININYNNKDINYSNNINNNYNNFYRNENIYNNNYNYNSYNNYYKNNNNYKNINNPYNQNFNKFGKLPVITNERRNNFNYNENYSSIPTPDNYEPFNNYNTFHNNNKNKFDYTQIQKTDHEKKENDNNCLKKEFYELNTLLNNLDMIKKDDNSQISKSKEDNINEINIENINININKSIFLDTKKNFIKELFSKYQQNSCISNYSILKNRIDININIEKEQLQKIKLENFFDCFRDINCLSLNIPFINKKGNILNCELIPTLNSFKLILKAGKKIETTKQKNNNYTIIKINKDLLKIEYEEHKPSHQRDLLYNKIYEIKQIIGENKYFLENVLIDKSYFCILWSFTNTQIIHSSFLAYYSFDFKLIGIMFNNLNLGQFLSSFSSDIDNYQDYKKEYDKNIENIKTFINNLTIEKVD